MASVKRYDRITIDASKAIRLDNGMMKVPARIGRVGVQNYVNARGEVERVYRPADEVFAADSVATFDGVALVNDHPRIDNSTVTAKNVKRLQIGTVMAPRPDGDFLAATLMVADADGVALIDSGKQELSCGYFCDRVKEAGIYTDSQGQQHPYDFVQRSIRGNHVALVTAGRAGPDVRIQLDSESAVMVTDIVQVSAKETHKMDPVEAAKQAALAAEFLKQTQAEATKLTADKAELNAKCEKLQATCDAKDVEIKKLTADLAAAPAKALEQAKVEAKLTADCAEVLGADEAAKLKPAELKRAVIAKRMPEIKLDGKSVDYIDAMFDAALAAKSANPAAEKVAVELAKAKAEGKTPVADAETPRVKSERAFFNPKK